MNDEEYVMRFVANESKRVRSLLKEPLIHFLLIGSALFFLYGWRGGTESIPAGQASPATQISVTEENIEQMTGMFIRTWQRPPTEEEQKGIIEDFIRNEIYYREAIALGLDRDDEVLKRRLRQKMEFIYEDITSWAEPEDEDLKVFMEKYREKYLTDQKVAFRQVYLNPDRRKSGAESDARQILAQLNAGRNPDEFGDATFLELEVPLSPLWDISKQFGESFSKSLLEAETGAWFGPVRSGFGLHLVFVRQRLEAHLPELNEVREEVTRDWTIQKQKTLKDAAYGKIRERYTVTVERPKATAALAANETSREAASP